MALHHYFNGSPERGRGGWSGYRGSFAKFFTYQRLFVEKSRLELWPKEWRASGHGGRPFAFGVPIIAVSKMAFVSKWFGFGHDPAFDDGVRAFEKKEFEIAMEHFRTSASGAADRALRDRARSYLAGCLGRMGRLHFDRRQFQEAHVLLMEATEVRPSFADLWLLRARVEKALSKWDDARRSVEEALEINPNYGAALVIRGVLLFHEGETQTGFRSVEEGVRLDDRLVGKNWIEGETAFRQGDYLTAMSQFEEMEPRGSDIHHLLGKGDSLAKKGEWLAAANLFKAVTEIAPAYADVRVRLGQCYLEMSELNLAQKAFQHAIAANPEFAEAYALLGVTARRQRDEDTAKAAFRKALEFDPNHPIASQEILYRPRF